MVNCIVRQTVSDYAKWRPIYDADEVRRRAAGATGVNQVFRDVDDPNTVTVVLEWDNTQNAHKFINDPALAEVMKKAGVIGMPSVIAVTSHA